MQSDEGYILQEGEYSQKRRRKEAYVCIGFGAIGSKRAGYVDGKFFPGLKKSGFLLQ